MVRAALSRPLATALGAYVLLALLICAPVLGSPAELALGNPLADTWNHVWGYWHLGSALSEGRSPLDASMVRYPLGGPLWFVDPVGALVTLPVQAALGPVAALNAAVFFNVVLAGLGAWALARHVSGSEPGALLAGLLYASSPHLLAQAHNGITETLAVGWLPLALWAWMRALQGPSARRGVAWGLALALCGLSNWYYGLFAGAMTGLLVLHALWRTPRRLRAALPTLVLGAAAMAALVAPAALAFAATLNAPGAVVDRDPEFVWRTLVGHNMTDLVSFFRPGQTWSPDLKVLFDEDLLVVVYLGWVALGVALWGLIRDPWGSARIWALGAASCFVLALGPFLYINGAYVRLGEDLIPLPFLALFDLVPAVSRISHAYRLVVPLGLCLAMMAALALRGRSWGWALGLGLAHLLELGLLAPVIFPLPAASARVPAVYASLPQGAVLDLPASLQVLARSRYHLYQTAHGRPIPYGLNDPTPTVLQRNPLTRALLELERGASRTLPPRLPVLELEAGRRALIEDGYGSVVVHLGSYPAGQELEVLTLLEMLCGEGTAVEGAVRFDLSR